MAVNECGDRQSESNRLEAACHRLSPLLGLASPRACHLSRANIVDCTRVAHCTTHGFMSWVSRLGFLAAARFPWASYRDPHCAWVAQRRRGSSVIMISMSIPWGHTEARCERRATMERR